MGNWTIVIHGTGAHHNGKPYDADAIAATVVKDLQEAGQVVHHATITTGSMNALTQPVTGTSEQVVG